MDTKQLHPPSATLRLLRLPSVEQMTGLSKWEIYKRIKEGSFPKPLKLGVRAVAWPEPEIQKWIQDLIKEANK